MPLSVLVTADVHLGRTSSQAPGLPPDRLRSRAAWDRLVVAALERRVAALVVAGDLIDAENRRWEVLGPLARDIATLNAAGVRVILTAGNHDWESLRRLQEAIGGKDGSIDRQGGATSASSPHFTLLGAGGVWARSIVEAHGERLAIDGWSFPAEQVPGDPIRLHGLEAPSGLPVLGVAHGEVGASGGRYAPIARASLDARPVDGWVVGHVHRPALVDLPRGFLLSPGSPQALDFGERGAHGAWLISVAGGRLASPQFLPLSSVRYERLDVSLDGIHDSAEAERAAVDALIGLERRCLDESGEALEGLSIRVRLSGRASLDGAIGEARHDGSTEPRSHHDLARHLMQWQGATRLAVQVTDVIDDLMPRVDLATLAAGTGSSPLVTTARWLRTLTTLPAPEEAGAKAAAGPAPQEVGLEPTGLESAAGDRAELESLLREVAGRLREVDDQPEYSNIAAGPSEDRSDQPADELADELAVELANDPARAALATALRRVLASLVQQEEA